MHYNLNMSIKLFAVLFSLYLGAECLDYTYDNLAGGWFKLHKPSSWGEASIRCDAEGAVLVAPVNPQIRDAIRNYVTREGMPGATILTGIQADYATGDYYSIEGVHLEKMPVIVDSDQSVDYKSSQSCVNWVTSKDEVAIAKCTDIKPFVCFKKRKTLVVAGCATHDEAYSYDYRSGSCYKFHRVGQTWPNAYKTCKQEGGYLAIINSQLEHKVVIEVFNKNPSSTLQVSELAIKEFALLGFRDWQDGESWKTVHGQTLAQAGFDTWAAGEPNNSHGNEHCGSIYRLGNFNDVDCAYKYAFICEKNPEILYTQIPRV